MLKILLYTILIIVDAVGLYFITQFIYGTISSVIDRR